MTLGGAAGPTEERTVVDIRLVRFQQRDGLDRLERLGSHPTTQLQPSSSPNFSSKRDL